MELDSGLDLMTSKELSAGVSRNGLYRIWRLILKLMVWLELDGRVMDELARLLDDPLKACAKLADSLGILSSMQTVLEKQSSPTTYLLRNLDVSVKFQSPYLVSFCWTKLAVLSPLLFIWGSDLLSLLFIYLFGSLKNVSPVPYLTAIYKILPHNFLKFTLKPQYNFKILGD